MNENDENNSSYNKFQILKLNTKHKPRNSNYSKNSLDGFSIGKTTDRGRSSFPTMAELKFSRENISGRNDIFGNEIKKGNKEHKISFIDQISNQKIAEVILIDNNNNNNTKKNNQTICNCQSCFIF